MRTILKSKFVILFFTALAACTPKPESPANQEPTTEALQTQLIERGEYLTLAAGCDHCHTPKTKTPEGPVPNMERWLSGFPEDGQMPQIDRAALEPGYWTLFHPELTAAVGPWGLTYAANLTPDETGMGNWTFDNFRKAMQEGKHKGLDGGRSILPPMPWQAYNEAFSLEDLEAIFAYLQSIEPIKNLVPPYVPATAL